METRLQNQAFVSIYRSPDSFQRLYYENFVIMRDYKEAIFVSILVLQTRFRVSTMKTSHGLGLSCEQPRFGNEQNESGIGPKFCYY